MRKLRELLLGFLNKEERPTWVEYAAILALVTVFCLTTIATLGLRANNTFKSVGSSLTAS